MLLQFTHLSNEVSIRPSDFDRLVMPCYGEMAQASAFSSSGSTMNQQNYGGSNYRQFNGDSSTRFQSGRLQSSNENSAAAAATSGNGATYLGSSSPTDASLMASSLRQIDSTFNAYGEKQFPRANTIDNFISLVAKLEAAVPRLAQNPDQLARLLLERFRLDNYYYDPSMRVHISEQDQRTRDIIPALLNVDQSSQFSQFETSTNFPEQVLDQNEKCSLYFMLSHFIQKTGTGQAPLASQRVAQLNTGPLQAPNVKLPPYLQAAGSGYPSRSASAAYAGAGSSQRDLGTLNNGGDNGALQQHQQAQPAYSGPSPGFGSPATQNMISFGSGINNRPEPMNSNPYGVNSPQRNLNPYIQMQRQFQKQSSYPSDANGAPRLPTSLVIAGTARNDEFSSIAFEYGVVTLGNQENSALVLNRVLMGILAAGTRAQTLDQLSRLVYPSQAISQTSKSAEELDPLFAVTLADLWAVSSIPKTGRRFDQYGQLGTTGHWNDSVCPLVFRLSRPEASRFTQAELAGGLDGFNLGKLRRELMQRGKTLRLSNMLRMYYSREGFGPRFGQYTVCYRASGINSDLDALRRQAENYLRLYEMNLPTSDIEIANSIEMLSSFKRSISQLAESPPAELCASSGGNDMYSRPGDSESCEIPKTDAITLMDVSQRANDAFMKLAINRLAQKLALSRAGNRLTILSNQQNSAGIGGFNVILRNCSNVAEVGCSLMYDTTSDFGGGQINDPIRLQEMFEQAFIALDTEHLTRQSVIASGSSSYQRQPGGYFYHSDANSQAGGSSGFDLGGGEETGGSKVLIWFNYGQPARPAQLAGSATAWAGTSSGSVSMSSSNFETYSTRLQEAKDFLRENFRGAAILVVTNNREEAKPFVFDEQRDIFTDLASSSSSEGIDTMSGSSSQVWADSSTRLALSGQVDTLVDRLVARMCEIPALFQYPRCFRAPSESVTAQGLITPGKKQYWMMAPKTFVASQSVKMIFRVEGGRLRICFGRMAHPEESANRYGQSMAGSNYITASGSNPGVNSQGNTQLGGSSSSSTNNNNNYYTGSEYGVCKDVGPGQAIDFVVDTPCWHKSPADCQPFYFDIRETSLGEGDLNYLCRDENCKRLDQVKWTMTHTGVYCSSANSHFALNWILSGLLPLLATSLYTTNSHLLSRHSCAKTLRLIGLMICSSIGLAHAQQAGVHDFGEGRQGEKRGDMTPMQVLSIVLMSSIILAGFGLVLFLCYLAAKRHHSRTHGKLISAQQQI